MSLTIFKKFVKERCAILCVMFFNFFFENIELVYCSILNSSLSVKNIHRYIQEASLCFVPKILNKIDNILVTIFFRDITLYNFYHNFYDIYKQIILILSTFPQSQQE